MSFFPRIRVETNIAPRETGLALSQLPWFLSQLHFQAV